MSESDMRGKVVDALKGMHPFSVENLVATGTPDVNYADGWLELKWAREWPKGEDTPLRVDHWTPQQKLWQRMHHRAGGQSHVLLQVREDWILLGPLEAIRYLSEVPRARLIEVAERHWTGEKEMRRKLPAYLKCPRVNDGR